MKNFALRMTHDLADQMRAHLSESHEFAAERVGFAFGRTSASPLGEIVVLCDFAPVQDDHYERDPWVGARIGQLAITAALQLALKQGASTFHVHMHEHLGTPGFSGTDLKELPPIMKPFSGLISQQPHGLLLLSHDECVALAWRQGDKKPRATRRVSVVGPRLSFLARG